jgi:hypothetical protein
MLPGPLGFEGAEEIRTGGRKVSPPSREAARY